MNRATIAGIVEDDPVLSATPTGEPTLSMRVAVPGMGRGETGSIPVRQYGRTAVRIISQRVAPSASAASLCSEGTVEITSRAIAETIGRIMIARIRPAMK